MAERADITITVAGSAVGTLREASLETSLGVLPAAAEDTYGARRHVAGVFVWQASGGTFLPSAGYGGSDLLLGSLAARVPVAVVVTFETGETETGSAFVTAWEATGAVGEALTGTFQLTGTGALTAT